MVQDIQGIIERYVEEELKKMSDSQLRTVEALLYSGYKGEREPLVQRLLEKEDIHNIASSPLIESFKSVFEDETALYWRIKPEFYRSVRKRLSKIG